MHMPGDSAGPEGSSMGDMTPADSCGGRGGAHRSAAWPTTAVPGVGCGHSDIRRCGGRRQDIRIAVGGPAQCGCAWLWRVIFRRNANQILAQGRIVGYVARHILRLAQMRSTPTPRWLFPSGARISFACLEDEAAVLKWQGSQIALICFDELTHFSRAQFFYMLSRNRSTCGVRPYVRATCNPDSDSWVADLVSWWISPETGYPLPERSGVKALYGAHWRLAVLGRYARRTCRATAWYRVGGHCAQELDVHILDVGR